MNDLRTAAQQALEKVNSVASRAIKAEEAKE